MNFVEACNLFTALAMAVLAAACIVALYVGLKNRTLIGEMSTSRRIAIGPYQWFLIGFFVSTVFLFYPIYHCYEIGEGSAVVETGFTHIFKSVVMSVHNTIRLFVVDGDYEIINNTIAKCPEFGGFFARFYSTYMAATFVIAPLITAGFVLSLFKEASSYFRYLLTFNANFYYLSELNERSITLAEDIVFPHSYMKERTDLGLLSPLLRGIKGTVKSSVAFIKYFFVYIFNNKEKDRYRSVLFSARRNVVIFADVYRKEDEQTAELIARAKRLGAICLRKCITEINLRHFEGRQRKLYFIGSDEDENTRQMLSMITRCISDPKGRYNTPNTEMYLFADTVEGGILLDTVNNGRMKVRSVRRTRNLVTSTFYRPVEIYERKRVAYRALARKHGLWREGKNDEEIKKNAALIDAILPLPSTIYDDYVKQDGKKVLNVVLVGLGGYGTEFLKTFCWCSQMPDYFVNVHAFDSNPEAEKKLEVMAPELVRYNKVEQKEGINPLYRLHVYPGIDADSKELTEKICAVKDITHIFVALGNDELNISTAIRINTALERLALTSGGTVPVIHTIVYNAIKNYALLTGEEKKEGAPKKKADRCRLAKAEREARAALTEQLSGLLECSSTDRRLRRLVRAKLRLDDFYADPPASRLKASDGHLYNIRFFGSMRQRYSLEFIERRHIEILGEAVNKNWSGVVGRIEKLRAGYDETKHDYTSLYNHYEYHRHSSIASAVHGGIWWYTGKKLGLDDYEIVANGREYEHIRWAAFMRAEGFVVSPGDNPQQIPKNFVAKTHPCLEYNYKPKISDEDKAKDEAAIEASKREN